MALSCNGKHNSSFFDQCCHPLLKSESLSSRPAQCNPAAAAAAAPPSDDGDDDDLPFCDDGDDDTDSAAPVPSAPKAPAPKPVAATPAPQKAAPAPAQAAPVQAPKSAPVSGAAPTSNAAVETGGFATFFYQNGVAGACGTVHSDNDFIAAIDGDRYGNLGAKSSLCGKKVKLTNANNKKSVTVVIADACPTCKNGNSIDLSSGAFKQIATLDEGMVPITWSFV
jgi:hypothetical protein